MIKDFETEDGWIGEKGAMNLQRTEGWNSSESEGTCGVWSFIML